MALMYSFLRRDCSFLAVALVALFASLTARAGFDPASTRSAETEQTLKLEYRLQPDAQVQTVQVTQNGGDVEFRHTAFGRDILNPSALLVMLDTSAGSVRFPRDHTLAANKALVQALLAELPRQNLVAVYSFANDLAEIVPFGPPPSDLPPRLTRLKADGLGTRIYRQGISAVGLLKATPAARKTLLIISDGKDEDNGFTRDDLVKCALAHGVTICAMGCPESGVDIPALGNLEKLAAETHGLYAQAKIGEGDPGQRLKIDTAFARSVLAQLNSGGEIQVPLDHLDPAGDVTFSVTTKAGESFTYVHKRTGAAAPAASPTPASFESVAVAASTPTLAVAAPSPVARPPVRPAPARPAPPKATIFTPANLISGGAILLLIVAVVVLRLRPVPGQAVAAPRAFLVIQDAESRRIPLEGSAIRIGRRPDNDIVFGNTSVSGYHAEIHLQRDGAYLITDLGSGNGLKVNDQTVSQASLQDGDLVEMGEVRFRFHHQ
ncbi:MAG: FHA domain-containing protein [Chthoniobacteraceae bacterium]